MSNLSVGRNDANGLVIETVDTKSGSGKPAADRSYAQHIPPYNGAPGPRLFPGARVGMKVVSITYIAFNGDIVIHGYDTTKPYGTGGPYPYDDEIDFSYEQFITVDNQIQKIRGAAGGGVFLVLLESQ